VEGGYLELPSCCKNLVAIGQLKHALPSQRFSLTRSKTEYFCKIFELDHGIFLDIVARYDPMNLWDLFENFLDWENRGCFTMGQYCPEDKWNFLDKTLYWTMKYF
jgi:hypothetical protein